MRDKHNAYMLLQFVDRIEVGSLRGSEYLRREEGFGCSRRRPRLREG